MKVKTCVSVLSGIVCVVSFIVVTTVEIEGIKFSETYVFPLYHLLLYFLSGISLVIFFYCGIYCSIRDKILRWLDKETWLDRFALSRGMYPRKEEIKNETYIRLLREERAWRRSSWIQLITGLIILFFGTITPPIIKNNQYMMVFGWSKHITSCPFLNIYWAEEVHPLFFWVYAFIYLVFISDLTGSVIFVFLKIISKKNKIRSEEEAG